MSKRKSVAVQSDAELEHAAEVSPLDVRLLRIDQLQADPDNVREHNPRNLDSISASLAAFGQQKPIVVDRDMVIVAGHGTVEAARALGWERIAVVVTDLQGEKRTAYAIADNRVGELSFFDESKLMERLGSIHDHNLVIGFDEGELAELAGMLPRPSEVSNEGDRAPVARSGERAITVRATLSIQSTEIFERALAATGLMNREDALLLVCRVYLSTKGASR